MTKNIHVTKWIDEMAAMTQPDKIVWIDGSEAQAEKLRKEACSTGELIKLNEELLPKKRTEILIEKDLEKGFDYRKITVEEME